MSTPEDLAAEATTECGVFQGPEIGPFRFESFGEIETIRCHQIAMQLTLGHDGDAWMIGIGLRLDHTALAYYPTADQARRIATTLLRAADLIDGGRGKQ